MVNRLYWREEGDSTCTVDVDMDDDMDDMGVVGDVKVDSDDEEDVVMVGGDWIDLKKLVPVKYPRCVLILILML